MTKEQAVIQLEYRKDFATPDQIEALDMAISALSENKEDLISRQAVLDELEKWDWQDLYLPSHFKQLLDDVPSVENKGGWIPVTERLPENNDDVLVYDGSDIFVAWYGGIDGNWCSADNRFDEYTPIVAWQPLPEPYKKGE